MLRELRIRDIAIIEDLAVEFGPGLNVLSGETGAGKSIILGALGLVLGARASSEMVRSNAESAEVQARVDRDDAVDTILRELDLCPAVEDEGLLLRRIVTRSGRSRAYVGEAAVSVGTLRRLASVLVDYASQHEHQVLLDERQHLGVLDRFGGLHDLVANVGEAVSALRRLVTERSRLARLDQEQRAREDYLRFQLDELERLAPTVGEQEELQSRRIRLRHAEELMTKAREAQELLYSGSPSAMDQISQSLDRLRDLAAIDRSLEASLQSVEPALILVEEAGRDLAAYVREVRADPVELQEVEDRLAALAGLARKHHCDSDALQGVLERTRGELTDLEGLEERLEELDPLIEKQRAVTSERCTHLASARQQAAKRLGGLVEEELTSLSMDGARFVPELRPLSLYQSVASRLQPLRA